MPPAVTSFTTAHRQLVRARLEESLALHRILLELSELVARVADVLVEACLRGKKILFFGNGGSAADAQHLAAELGGRYYRDRRPLPALALHTNTSLLTALANDYSYEEVFSRQIEAWGEPGDVALALSTSGNSPNVIRALETAREKGLITVGLAGEGGGKMRELCDYCLCIPSRDTPRIQEAHILIGHILCEIVEQYLPAP